MGGNQHKKGSDPQSPSASKSDATADSSSLTEFEIGVLVGVLIGEGHFGGDGRQPQVTLRMHTRSEALFHWLQARIPGARLYGPYNHGGRHYYQWMVRGKPLRDFLLPLLDERITEDLDGHAFRRYQDMKRDYSL